MQTVTNVFITNLALSDILVSAINKSIKNHCFFFVFQMCCLAVPFTPISAYANTWHLGRILCHLVPMSLGTSGKISLLFLIKNLISSSSSQP